MLLCKAKRQYMLTCNVNRYCLSACTAVSPANTRHWTTVGSMLGHRLRRWPTVESTMAQSLCLLGLLLPFGFAQQSSSVAAGIFVLDHGKHLHPIMVDCWPTVVDCDGSTSLAYRDVSFLDYYKRSFNLTRRISELKKASVKSTSQSQTLIKDSGKILDLP